MYQSFQLIKKVFKTGYTTYYIELTTVNYRDNDTWSTQTMVSPETFESLLNNHQLYHATQYAEKSYTYTIFYNKK